MFQRDYVNYLYLGGASDSYVSPTCILMVGCSLHHSVLPFETLSFIVGGGYGKITVVRLRRQALNSYRSVIVYLLFSVHQDLNHQKDATIFIS